jgi:predicted extracellular nuclease
MSTKRFSISKGIVSLMIMLVAVIALVACGGNNDQKLVDEALDAIAITYQTGDTDQTITKNITLPTTSGTVTVTWTSSNTAVISNAGVVTRGEADTVVSLTATLTLGDVSETKVFTVKVLAAPVVVDPADALAALTITGDSLEYNETTNRYTTTSNVTLPGVSQTLTVTWTSGNEAVISAAGVVTRPAWGQTDSTAILTATIGEETRSFIVTVLAETVKPVSAKLADASDALLLAGVSNGIAADITLPTTAGSEGVTVTWSSDNEAALTAAGVVTRAQTQVTVTLTATLSLEGQSVTKEFEVVILPFAEFTVVADLAAAIAGGKGLYVQVPGVTVVGRSTDGYMIYDGSALLFVYTGGEPAASVVVGSVFDVTGLTDYYNGSFQFNGTKDPNMPAILKASTEAASVLTPTVITGSVSEYVAALPTAYTEASPLVYSYIQISGRVRVQNTTSYGSFLVDIDHDGSDINSDANSPYTDDALMIYYKSNKADFDSFNGQKVTINVFLYSLRTDRNIYTFIFTGVAADVTIIPLTDQESVDGAKEALVSEVDAYVVENGTLTLPTDTLGTTITWASSNETVINPTTGAVTRVEGAQTEVTLTATITKGTVTDTQVVVVKVGVPPLSTVQQVVDATVNSTLYTVRGVVTASEYYRTYFIQQGDAGIAVYTSNSTMLATLKANIGKEVEVIGTRAAFNGLRQVAPQYVTVVGEATLPTAVNVDDVELDATAMLPYQGRLVTLTQLKVVELPEQNYGNIVVRLQQVATGKMIEMKWDSRVTLSTAAKATLDGLAVNDLVDITAVLAWNNAPYLYFSDTVVVTDTTLTDASKVAMDTLALTQPTRLTEAGTLTLPELGSNGSTIVWSLVEASSFVDLVAKTVTIPTTGLASVTLKATVTLNDQTKEVTFEIILGAATVATDLFISEYIEGSSNNKAIEIYNGTGADVDLTGYKVALYSNGATTYGNNIELTGTLKNGETLVIVNSGAAAEFKVEGFIASTITYFNGDDAVALLKNEVVIDAFGIIGTDPGSNWVVGTGTTAEFTLVRKATVTGPTTTWNPAEWVVYPQNTATYLGSHTMGA